MRVLAIGKNGVEMLAQDSYPDAEIDVIPVKPRNMQKDYDALVSYMVLQRVYLNNLKETVGAWVHSLKQGGEILVFVPSLEWAAYQVLSPEPSPALLSHLYGSEKEPSLCGFTMLDMRSLLSNSGIAVTHAQTGEYLIGEYPCECHVLRGIKK